MRVCVFSVKIAKPPPPHLFSGKWRCMNAFHYDFCRCFPPPPPLFFLLFLLSLSLSFFKQKKHGLTQSKDYTDSLCPHTETFQRPCERVSLWFLSFPPPPPPPSFFFFFFSLSFFKQKKHGLTQSKDYTDSLCPHTETFQRLCVHWFDLPRSAPEGHRLCYLEPKT